MFSIIILLVKVYKTILQISTPFSHEKQPGYLTAELSGVKSKATELP